MLSDSRFTIIGGRGRELICPPLLINNAQARGPLPIATCISYRLIHYRLGELLRVQVFRLRQWILNPSLISFLILSRILVFFTIGLIKNDVAV